MAARNGGIHNIDSWASATRIHGRPLGGILHAVDRYDSATRIHGRPLGGVLVLLLSPGGDPSNTAPVISNRTPSPDAIITRGGSVSFDVTDPTGLLFVEVQVDQLMREVVHDGDAFLSPYQNSTRDPISNGYHYVIVRTGGWVIAPVFRVRAFDVQGAQA